METRSVAFLIAVALLFGCTGAPVGQPNNNTNITNATNNTGAGSIPLHSTGEISAYMQKHLVVYYGLWSVEAPVPGYSHGEWSADVGFLENGAPQTLRLIISDSDLSVKEMWLKVLINTDPTGIVPIPSKLSCSEGGKVKVIEFANPYCPNCIASENAIGEFKKKFNGSIDYEYQVMLPKTNAMIEAYGYTNVSLTSKYYACAQEQGLLDNFRKCVTERYAKQGGKPLEQNWLDSCAIDEGLNLTNTKNCVIGADKMIDLGMKLGQTYLGDYAKLPSFVVDCRFKTSDPNLVSFSICYEFPKTAGC